MSFVVANAQSVTIGVGFTFLVFLPALITGLIVVAVVTARGEKTADAELAGKWGRRRTPSDS
jgi:hypothetical protein